MLRRSLMAAVAAAALVSTGSPASAQAFCNTTVGGPFDGTEVCVVDQLTSGTIPVPYSVGQNCVAGQCTPAASGTINVPVPSTQPAYLYGTLCVPGYKGQRVCVPFDTRIVVAN